MQARCLFEYGEAREGYWTCDNFMEQMKRAIKIAEFKYPKSDGWKHVWIFDQSGCHAAMADDSLNVSKMNVNPGGKQRVMRDGYWNEKVFKMNYAIGVPKGLCVVLQQRGVDTSKMNADLMIERVWAQAKRYSKAYCKYSIVSLRKTVVPALESVSLESIQKHFRKKSDIICSHI